MACVDVDSLESAVDFACVLVQLTVSVVDSGLSKTTHTGVCLVCTCSRNLLQQLFHVYYVINWY